MSRRLLLLIALLGLADGCSPRIDAPLPPGPTTPSRARQWLEAVEVGHAEVDRLLDGGDANGAQAVLSKLLAQAPPSELGAENARMVLQDLDARLAEVELRRSAPEPALAAARHGIGLGIHDDVFGANLHIVEARSLEALGRDAEAAASYHQALLISETLLEEALDVDPTP